MRRVIAVNHHVDLIVGRQARSDPEYLKPSRIDDMWFATRARSRLAVQAGGDGMIPAPARPLCTRNEVAEVLGIGRVFEIGALAKPLIDPEQSKTAQRKEDLLNEMLWKVSLAENARIGS